MARNMADDYQDTYRARIVWKRRTQNTDWDWGDDRTERYVDDPEAPEWVTCYGPYATKGVAKAQFSQYRHNHAEGSVEIISETVQKASITWEDVE